MTQLLSPTLQARRMRGLSLIELLVGITVGLLATLVIMQMYATFEGQKRTSTTGADAQENALIALATVERDVRMAGNGLADSPMMNCSTLFSAYDNGGGSYTLPAPGFTSTGIAPAAIVDGGTGTNNSDTITLVYGLSWRSSIGSSIRQSMPTSASDLKLTNVYGFAVGQKVFVTDGTNCTIMEVTQVQTPAGGSGLYGVVHQGGTSAYNPPASVTNGPPAWPAYGIGSMVYSLDGFTARRYSIGVSGSTSALFAQELATAGSTATAIVGDIVNMQAQYGVAPAGSQQVTCWTDATGSACGGTNWASPTPAEIKRIKALRVAIVSRSALAERPSVTGSSCDTTTTAPATWSGGPAVNLTGDPNWKCYRYKVYQTVIPLRNVIWANL